MTFALPPLTLPADIIAKQAAIQTPPGVDAGFYNTILGLSDAGGLFTNPFAVHIAGLNTITSQLTSIEGVAGSVGGAADLSTIMGHVSDMTTIFSNIATNIVPTPLPMSSVLSAAVTSSCGSLPDINPNDSQCLAPFVTALGVPQLGQIMNLSLSQYSLAQLCGTVSPTNPMPLLNQFSSMLTNMTAGATSFLSSTASMVTGLLESSVEDLAGALGSGVSSIESALGSCFGSPIASFGSSMFSAIKDQMSTGLASSMRHMVETNYAMKFMITGTDSTGGGSFGGILGSGVASAITDYPSNINVGHIIP